MIHKKTILHIIQNFGRGGAETAVVGVLKNLTEYNNVVVAMNNINQFGDELKCDKYYSLDLKTYYHFPLAIKKLSKIIIDNRVDLVHSQLYWSTVLARFACPANIPLVTSIQASLTNSFEYKKKWIGWLDKFTYNRSVSTILGVSKDTLDDYFHFLKLKKQRCHVLYNFVDTKTFPISVPEASKDDGTFRLITVGSLKLQKNQQYLLEAFTKLRGENISLDIYGEGLLRDDLSKYILAHKLPVRLMGNISNLNKEMVQYDLFVMPSLYEGFSLAVLEGMFMEKPMLLSDIPTFTEQCAGTAEYFSLFDVNDLVHRIKDLKNDPARLKQLSLAGKERVMKYFTLDHHMAALRKIYSELLNDQLPSP